MFAAIALQNIFIVFTGDVETCTTKNENLKHVHMPVSEFAYYMTTIQQIKR